MNEKRRMGVSLDGLRRNLANNYNSLVRVIHDHTLYKDVQKNGDALHMNMSDIQEEMEGLRRSIAMLHCVFMEDIGSFSDLSNDIDNILHFNPQPDNNEG